LLKENNIILLEKNDKKTTSFYLFSHKNVVFMTEPISITKLFLELVVIFLVAYYEAPLLFYIINKNYKIFFFYYKLVTLFNLYKFLLVRFKI
jgi:hypothetical protein